MTTATNDVCTIATYLDDVVKALRKRGIPVETGFVSAMRRSSRQLVIRLSGSHVLAGATLSWQSDLGWSLISGERPWREWILPLNILAEPREIARTVRILIATLRTTAIPA